MFFVFPLLFLSVYVSDINNFALKNESQGLNVKQYDKDLFIQDVQNDSPVVPTIQSVLHVIHNYTKTQNSKPKSNKFTRKLSDDIPIKRHITDEETDEEDIPSMFTSTTSSIATSTLESKRKWPVVEFISHSYDSVENAQYLDKLERKGFPFFHDDVNKSKIIDFPPKYINRHLYLRKNHSKDKPVGLRSLPQQNFPGPSCEENDKCVCRLPSKTSKTGPILNKCTRSSILNSFMNIIPERAPKPTTTPNPTPRPPGSQGFDMGYLAMGVPMGIPAGYPGGYLPGYPGGYLPGYPGGFPAGYPAAIPASPVAWPPGYYQEGPKQKKPNKKPSDDYLYYDDDDDDDAYDHDDDEHDNIHNYKGKKKKHKGDVFIDIEYDIEDSSERKPNRIPKCRKDTEDLATDIINDIRKTETIIKNCYCCSASCCGIKFGIVFLYSILVTFSSSNITRFF